MKENMFTKDTIYSPKEDAKVREIQIMFQKSIPWIKDYFLYIKSKNKPRNKMKKNLELEIKDESKGVHKNGKLENYENKDNIWRTILLHLPVARILSINKK